MRVSLGSKGNNVNDNLSRLAEMTPAGDTSDYFLLGIVSESRNFSTFKIPLMSPVLQHFKAVHDLLI